MRATNTPFSNKNRLETHTVVPVFQASAQSHTWTGPFGPGIG